MVLIDLLLRTGNTSNMYNVIWVDMLQSEVLDARKKDQGHAVDQRWQPLVSEDHPFLLTCFFQFKINTQQMR